MFGKPPKNDTPLKHTLAVGLEYEKKIIPFITKKGCQVIQQNYRTRYGEIDIIAIQKNILCFIEVRYRKKQSMVNASMSVDYFKQQKIGQSAQYFLSKNPQYFEFFMRFDVIAIDANQIKWHQNCFEYSS